jgi:hypothetical protein
LQAPKTKGGGQAWACSWPPPPGAPQVINISGALTLVCCGAPGPPHGHTQCGSCSSTDPPENIHTQTKERGTCRRVKRAATTADAAEQGGRRHSTHRILIPPLVLPVCEWQFLGAPRRVHLQESLEVCHRTRHHKFASNVLELQSAQQRRGSTAQGSAAGRG